MNVSSLSFSTLLLSVALLTAACSSEQPQNQAEAQQTNAPAQSNLDKAPNFEVTTISGETISLEQTLADNKPMVIYFTASWCPTCARNWPAMSEVYPEYADKLTMVAISIDPTDTDDVIRKLSEERGFTFPSTAGKPELMVEYGVRAQATTVGVNRDGYITFRKQQQALTADEYRELFASLIEG
ncbi:MAG: peroxiredoxin family protein [Balneolaceae bacterium]